MKNNSNNIDWEQEFANLKMKRPDKNYPKLKALIERVKAEAEIDGRIDELKKVRKSHADYYSDITDDARTISNLALHQYDYIDDRLSALKVSKAEASDG